MRETVNIRVGVGCLAVVKGERQAGEEAKDVRMCCGVCLVFVSVWRRSEGRCGYEGRVLGAWRWCGQGAGGGEGKSYVRACCGVRGVGMRGNIWPCSSLSLCWLVGYARPPDGLNMHSDTCFRPRHTDANKQINVPSLACTAPTQHRHET